MKKMENRFLLVGVAGIAVLAFGCSGGGGADVGCAVDRALTGYALAKAYDDCLAWNAQRTIGGITTDDIEVRAHGLSQADFNSSYAGIDVDARAVDTYYMFQSQAMGTYPDAPAEIDGTLWAKMKSRKAVAEAFGLEGGEQGNCAEVQQAVYDTVLESILTGDQKQRYLADGKPLAISPDDDQPPLGAETNPVLMGSLWLPVDPASMVTRDANGYSYEPMSLYLEVDDPAAADVEEGLKGVRYCKLLTHQAILSWMLSKSFESGPVLITPSASTECTRPASLENRVGSCLFFFAPAGNYYCSDHVGEGSTVESAQAACAKPTRTDGVFDTRPCSERNDEIEARIPGYAGLQGACVIHCGEPEETLWNVYETDLPIRCTGYPYMTAEELAAMAGGN